MLLLLWIIGWKYNLSLLVKFKCVSLCSFVCCFSCLIIICGWYGMIVWFGFELSVRLVKEIRFLKLYLGLL